MFCSGNYLRSDTLPYDLTSKNLLAADAAKPTTMYALVIKPDAGRRERRERMHKHEASAYHTQWKKGKTQRRMAYLQGNIQKTSSSRPFQLKNGIAGSLTQVNE